MSERALAGHIAVIDMRLDALKSAIESGDREQIEFQFDRVRRAVSKLDREYGSRAG